MTEEKKFSNLMAYGGYELQKIYYSIDKTTEETPKYKEVVKKLDEYFKPKYHAIFGRYKFWRLKSEPHDTLNDVILKIKDAAECCKFGSTAAESQDIAMTDKLLMLVPQEIKEKLLQKTELSFDEAIKIVQAHEATKFQASFLSNSTTEPEINRLNHNVRNDYKYCNRCGSKNHQTGASSCKAKDSQCHNCGKRGHYSRVCMSKKEQKYKFHSERKMENQNMKPFPVKRRKLDVRNINHVDEDLEKSHSSICNINPGGTKIICNIGQIGVRMLVDSGSDKNIIDEQTWRVMLAKGFQPKDEYYDNTISFTGYGNMKLNQV